MSPLIIALSISLPLCVVLIVITWLITAYINKRFKKYIFSEENSVRSFIVNKEKNTVRFFNTNNLRNVRELSLEQFYVQFSKNDVARLDEWFNSLLRKTGKPSPYFEVEVYLNKNKKKYLTVLKAINIDKENKILHIDSFLFLHLTTRTKHGYKIIDIPLEDAVKKLRVTPSLRGSTYNFKFHFVNNIDQPIEGNKLIFTELKEIALVYAYPPSRYLIEVSESDFAIIDYRIGENDAAINFVYKIIKAMRIYLEINSILQNVKFSVGIVANRNFPSNAKKLILKAQEMSEIAYQKNSMIVSYNKNIVNNEDHESEIENIIKEKKLKYLFTPVMDVRSVKPIGYISKVDVINSNVKNVYELYDHAKRTDESKTLLTSIVKDSSALFSNLKNESSLVLFRDLKFEDVPIFLPMIRSSSSKEARNVVCFEEYDISYYTSKNNDFIDNIEKLKAKAISSCLKLSDKTLVLDSKIYSQFDYFMIDTKLSKIRRSEVSNLSYRIIVEKLLKYNRPIILINADNWSIVELLVRNGIEYISSEALAETSEKLNTINSKNALKLKHMIN